MHNGLRNYLAHPPDSEGPVFSVLRMILERME
jgi:hypothetical protein